MRLANERLSPDSATRKKLIADLASVTCERDGDYDLDEAYARMCPELMSLRGGLFRDLCDENATESLSLLQDPTFQFKHQLIVALFADDRPAEAFTQSLVRLAKSRWSQVREAAITALDGRQGDGVKEAVSDAAYDRFAFVRFAAIHVIRTTDPQSAPKILWVLTSDPVESVRDAARAMLAKD